MSAAYEAGMKHYQIMWAAPMGAGATRKDLVERREMLSAALSRLTSIQLNCRYCTHLKVTTCTLFDSEVPEAFQKVADNECESWNYDALPF